VNLRSLPCLVLFHSLIIIGCHSGGMRDSAATEISDSKAYLPMKVGHKWTYGAKEGPDVTFEIVGKECVNGIECFKAIRTIEEEAIPFYVSLSDKGLMIHRVGIDDYDPPFLEFAFPITTPDPDSRTWSGSIGGRKYEIRTHNGGFEQVTIPTGTFAAICVSEKMEQVNKAEREGGIVIEASLRTHFWIVRDVGVVKLRGRKAISTTLRVASSIGHSSHFARPGERPQPPPPCTFVSS
jgi:hypothetical protein